MLQTGRISVWDASVALSDPSSDPIFSERLCEGEFRLVKRTLTVDAVGSVQLHPFKPYLLAVAASRRDRPMVNGDDGASDTSDDTDSESDDSSEGGLPQASRTDECGLADHVVQEAAKSTNGLRIWSFA